MLDAEQSAPCQDANLVNNMAKGWCVKMIELSQHVFSSAITAIVPASIGQNTANNNRRIRATKSK